MKIICKITIPMVTQPLNKMLYRHWADLYRDAKKQKKDYGLLLNAAIEDKHRITSPGQFRKVEIYSYRKKLVDPDGLYASVKYLLDSISDVGLIWDDGPEFLSLIVNQKIDRKNPRTEIIIYEI